MRAHTRAPETSPLTLIGDHFASRVDDQDALDAIQVALRRAESLAGSQRPSNLAVMSFAGEAFDICALDCGWGASEAAELVRELAAVLGEPAAATGAALFLAASRNPHLMELPPRVALQMQLEILVAFAPVEDVSVWVADPSRRIDCVAHVGTPTRTMRRIASRVIEGGSGEAEGRQTVVAVPIYRWGVPWGAMVARRRIDDRDAVDGYLTEAAATISPVIERDMLLERSNARERALVDAAEKRLLRLAFDLHDGPLQDLAALADDVRYTRRRLVPLLDPGVRSLAAGRFDDFDARLECLDRSLRDLSHSFESTSVTAGPLQRVLEREVNSFRYETGVSVELKIRGHFEPMTRSQKIALFRILQEALHNIREHSNATSVAIDVHGRPDRIEAHVEDDGTGFDVASTLVDAARRGRLGLVGMGERARLLGGKLDVRSSEGGPTVVGLMLPRWLPVETPAAEETAVV